MPNNDMREENTYGMAAYSGGGGGCAQTGEHEGVTLPALLPAWRGMQSTSASDDLDSIVMGDGEDVSAALADMPSHILCG